MKQISFLIMAIAALCSCSPSHGPKHESPTFLAVVDSICNKFPSDNGYDVDKVKEGMHAYMGYFAANENPIFKDLPMELDDFFVSNALDGSKLVNASFSYTFKEPMEKGSRVYSLHVVAENEYAANDSIPLVKGQKYIIVPSEGIVQYDGRLDILGTNENPLGEVVDGRSFGTLNVQNATFIPAK